MEDVTSLENWQGDGAEGRVPHRYKEDVKPDGFRKRRKQRRVLWDETCLGKCPPDSLKSMSILTSEFRTPAPG